MRGNAWATRWSARPNRCAISWTASARPPRRTRRRKASTCPVPLASESSRREALEDSLRRLTLQPSTSGRESLPAAFVCGRPFRDDLELPSEAGRAQVRWTGTSRVSRSPRRALDRRLVARHQFLHAEHALLEPDQLAIQNLTGDSVPGDIVVVRCGPEVPGHPAAGLATEMIGQVHG